LRQIEAKLSVPKDKMDRRIFVGGLPPDLPPDALKSYFQQFGEVEEAIISVEPTTGRTRGFGFVTLGMSSMSSVTCERVVGYSSDSV
jgi:RNA recognition motif-containing protein